LGGVFEAYADQVRKGTGIDPQKVSYTDPRFTLYNNLQADAARFAAHREAQKERELKAATDATEKAKIEGRYKEYLKTEKHGIFANSAAAERWTGFQENADLYPNLEWRTAGDSDVRAEHAALDGLTLPIDDAFWNSHTPPLGFGCRCELIQTDKKAAKTEGYDKTTAPKGFDFNPGIDQKIFSDTAGYYASASKEESVELTKMAKSFINHNSYSYKKEIVAGTAVKNKIGTIVINGTTKNEWINQPHCDLAAKNMMLLNPNFLKGLNFYPGPDFKANPMVKQCWFAEIELMNKKSVVIVREMTDGRKVLYSISDNTDEFIKYLK
jgi:SPP1 gp7 family putative phage head morphogenesis protein